MTDIDTLADTVEAVRARMLDRRLYVWVVHWDLRNYNGVDLFKTEENARLSVMDFLVGEGADQADHKWHASFVSFMNGESGLDLDDDNYVRYEEQEVDG